MLLLAVIASVISARRTPITSITGLKQDGKRYQQEFKRLLQNTKVIPPVDDKMIDLVTKDPTVVYYGVSGVGKTTFFNLNWKPKQRYGVSSLETNTLFIRKAKEVAEGGKEKPHKAQDNRLEEARLMKEYLELEARFIKSRDSEDDSLEFYSSEDDYYEKTLEFVLVETKKYCTNLDKAGKYLNNNTTRGIKSKIYTGAGILPQLYIQPPERAEQDLEKCKIEADKDSDCKDDDLAGIMFTITGADGSFACGCLKKGMNCDLGLTREAASTRFSFPRPQETEIRLYEQKDRYRVEQVGRGCTGSYHPTDMKECEAAATAFQEEGQKKKKTSAVKEIESSRYPKNCFMDRDGSFNFNTDEIGATTFKSQDYCRYKDTTGGSKNMRGKKECNKLAGCAWDKEESGGGACSTLEARSVCIAYDAEPPSVGKDLRVRVPRLTELPQAKGKHGNRDISVKGTSELQFIEYPGTDGTREWDIYHSTYTQVKAAMLNSLNGKDSPDLILHIHSGNQGLTNTGTIRAFQLLDTVLKKSEYPIEVYHFLNKVDSIADEMDIEVCKDSPHDGNEDHDTSQELEDVISAQKRKLKWLITNDNYPNLRDSFRAPSKLEDACDPKPCTRITPSSTKRSSQYKKKGIHDVHDLLLRRLKTRNPYFIVKRAEKHLTDPIDYKSITDPKTALDALSELSELVCTWYPLVWAQIEEFDENRGNQTRKQTLATPIMRWPQGVIDSILQGMGYKQSTGQAVEQAGYKQIFKTGVRKCTDKGCSTPWRDKKLETATIEQIYDVLDQLTKRRKFVAEMNNICDFDGDKSLIDTSGTAKAEEQMNKDICTVAAEFFLRANYIDFDQNDINEIVERLGKSDDADGSDADDERNLIIDCIDRETHVFSYKFHELVHRIGFYLPERLWQAGVEGFGRARGLTSTTEIVSALFSGVLEPLAKDRSGRVYSREDPVSRFDSAAKDVLTLMGDTDKKDGWEAENGNIEIKAFDVSKGTRETFNDGRVKRIARVAGGQSGIVEMLVTFNGNEGNKLVSMGEASKYFNKEFLANKMGYQLRMWVMELFLYMKGWEGGNECSCGRAELNPILEGTRTMINTNKLMQTFAPAYARYRGSPDIKELFPESMLKFVDSVTQQQDEFGKPDA